MPAQIPLNFWAILVSTIFSMVVGFLWYGPLFGKTWKKEQGITDADMKKSDMIKAPIVNFIGALVMAFILRHAVAYANVTTLAGGAVVGMLNWLGFIAVAMLNGVVYEKKSWKLYFINSGYYLVVLALNGAILASWV